MASCIAAASSGTAAFALGVATSGLSLTTIAVPPILALVIAAWGWRGGFLALAGLRRAGGATGSAAVHPLALAAGPARRLGRRADPAQLPGSTGAAPGALRSFWPLAGSVMLVNMATIGLVTRLVPFGLEAGRTRRPRCCSPATARRRSSAASPWGRWSIASARRDMAACAALLSAIGFCMPS